MIRKISKLIGTALGGLTGAAVAGLLALAGVEVTPAEATALAVLLSSLGAYLAPANAGPLPHLSADELLRLAEQQAEREQQQ